MKYLFSRSCFFLVTSFITFLILLLPFDKLLAQEDLNVVSGGSTNNRWLYFSDASNSLYHHLSQQAFDLLEQRATEQGNFSTSEEWKRRQTEIRETLANLLGPFPEKTPLNPQILNRLEKDFFTVEHLVYESQPGFYVTGSLFIPKELDEPSPAILFTSGHSGIAYRRDIYQQPLLNLVKKGFVVLAIDPLGQGERLQYYDPDTEQSVIGSSTLEHSYPSAQYFLSGQSIAKQFLWDGVRGIDYLVSRPEVDEKRIGVHGLSGGGTQTAYISAVDDRVAASAPSGYITSYRRLLESTGVQDGEQNLYHGILSKIDHGDYIAVRAPKPTLIMATTRDFFSIQGARETYSDVKRVFDVLGEPENLQIVEDDYGHGYTQKLREAMYAFFQEHLDQPGDSSEEELELLSEDEIRITPTGQVATSLGGETVFSLNQKEAEKQVSDLQSARENLDRHLPEVLNAARELSGYQKPEGVAPTVFTGRIQRDGYSIEKYFMNGEGDYIIPFLLMVPETQNNRSVLYLHPSGKSAEASAGGEMEWYVRQGYMVLAPDLVGLGEMGPGDLRGDAYIEGNSYNMWFMSLLVGRSITGIRAGDVVRLSHLLTSEFNQDEVYGVARRELGPVLLHAAAFEPTLSRVALIEPYSSYRSIVMNRFYEPDFIHSTVAGALGAYDLPDLAATLAPRRLLIAGVTDGSGEPLSAEDRRVDGTVLERAYRVKGAGEALILSEGRLRPDNLYSLLATWIE